MNNKIISKAVAGLMLFSMIGYTLPVFAYTKDETVYSKLDVNGDSYKTIVSTHIKNTENQDLLDDISDLLNIENTNGDETYTQNGNAFTWDAKGSDIYYQGETEKELPIECNVKYELNGEEVSAEDIAGKSGSAKITLEYTNKEERYVTVNGKTVKMYVPFVVVAGTILKSDNISNVTISSGKVINDGSKVIIVGIAMPGLQESLGISKDDLEIPSNIEITFDTTCFQTNSIVSYVTPKVLEKDDLSFFDDLDEIYNKVNTLQSSSKQIVDGSNQLKEGVEQAYNGATTISTEVLNSTNNLKADTSEALDEEMLKTIKVQAATAATLTEEQKEAIKAQATASAVLTEEQKETIKAQATASAVLTEEQKTSIKTNAKATIDSKFTEAYKNGIGRKALANVKSEVGETAYDNLEASGATQIIAETAISTAYNTAVATAQETAVATAQEVATTTATTVSTAVGNKAKKTFTNQVVSQMSSLSDGLNQLASGLSQLNEGANELAEGITKFNEEGIEKICNYINGDIKDVADRAEKLAELSKEYNNFTMLSEGNEGEVKFIMIIDGIKEQQESEQEKEDAVLDFNGNTSNEE